MDAAEWDRVCANIDGTLRKFDAKLSSQLASGRNEKEKRNIKLKLPSLKNDLSSLDAACDSFAANPRAAGLSDREVNAKMQALAGLQQLFKRVEEASGRVGDGGDREFLLGGDYANANSSRRNIEETEETMYLSNRDMLEHQRQQVENDDAALEQIALGLGTLKTIGMSQQKQFKKQDALLTELKDGVDNTDARMQNNIKRVDKVEEGSRGGCCAMLIMLVLLGLIISILASNWACHIMVNPKKNQCE